MTLVAAIVGALLVWLVATRLRRLGGAPQTAPVSAPPDRPTLSRLPAPYTEAFGSPEAAFQQLLEENGVSGARAETLRRAFALARTSHAHQKRDGTDDPYIYHPLDVLGTLLEELEVEDLDTLVAGLLHDVVEDGGVPPEQIEAEFGTSAAAIVRALTRREDETREAYLRRIQRQPKNVRLVKIADRLNNLEDLFYARDDRERVQEYLAQTREYILPMVREDAPVLLERFQRSIQTLEEGYERERDLERMRSAAEMVQGLDALLNMNPDERRRRELERRIRRARRAGLFLTEAGRVTGLAATAALGAAHVPLAVGLGAGTVVLWAAALSLGLWCRRQPSDRIGP